MTSPSNSPLSFPINLGRQTLARLFNSLMALQANLWLVPALYCIGFFIVTAGLYTAEIAYPEIFHKPITLFQGEAADAKTVVATLLSAMITMATLSISITIVVLSLAASQLGPRLIKSVMSDRRTKDFIGMFFGAIVACFVLTVILHSRQPDQPVPQTTIAFVFLVVFVNLFVLLGFVHHIAQSCMADSVIYRVSRELNHTIDRLAEDEGTEDESEELADLPSDFEKSGVPLELRQSGYIQHIGYKTVVERAAAADALVRIDVSAGYYGIAGERVGWIHGVKDGTDEARTLLDAIGGAITIDTTRTPTQDLEYSVRHLVEIAVRALSPGINDNYTAIQVVDQFSASLAAMFSKTVPNGRYCDEDGVARLWAVTTGPEDIVFNAFDRIRLAAAGKPDVTAHMLAKIKVLSSFARRDAVRSVLRDQVKAIMQDMECCSATIVDEAEIKSLADEAMKSLHGKGTE
ncbi:DUF2254 domain-containing protein [Hwanghaeella grinnelliae]|nr:DUF2254 domain-containing protein [Hwanghaeella grinnelliae]